MDNLKKEFTLVSIDESFFFYDYCKKSMDKRR